MRPLYLKTVNPDKRIHYSLSNIHIYFGTDIDALYYWFCEEVCKLSKVCSLDPIEKVVSWVVKEVKARGSLVIKDPSTHSKREPQMHILRIALQDLEDLSRIGRLNVGSRDRAIEEFKVQLDNRKFQKYVNMTCAFVNDRIAIYNMLDHAAPPYIVAEKSLERPTCENVRAQMANAARPIPPDIWSRHSGSHQVTRDGFSWIYIEPDEDITGLELEYVERPAQGHSGYVIASTIRENRSVPLLIELPGKQNDCCMQAPSCPTLEEHLQTLFPMAKIATAVKIQGGDNVLGRRIHELEFRKNEMMIL
ncbi:hypothetical protein M408DRAFT_107498 [Serendipita vermifera MAFF 305830]|uniref:Uncharacterized protein n=1 Tax=Serendipita vermifera MAFF 305830 TaxID=933852 RepID=A0A0C2WUF1_SERVB|nr:hypothetical protein M408DRAFT_107498 [Serendipita vermifera MAFF 305830]